MAVALTTEAGPEFARVAAALKELDPKLLSAFRKAIKTEVKPFVAVAQERIIDMPVKHANRAGLGTLRRRIAAGVTISVHLTGDAGVDILTHVPTPEGGIIPRGFDSPKGWRHPVFGGAWVRQVPVNPGWFVSTFAEAESPVAAALGVCLDEAVAQIAAAGL